MTKPPMTGQLWTKSLCLGNCCILLCFLANFIISAWELQHVDYSLRIINVTNLCLSLEDRTLSSLKPVLIHSRLSTVLRRKELFSWLTTKNVLKNNENRDLLWNESFYLFLTLSLVLDFCVYVLLEIKLTMTEQYVLKHFDVKLFHIVILSHLSRKLFQILYTPAS